MVLTVKAMRPMVPAKDFEISKKFYLELGFRPQTLADRVVEMPSERTHSSYKTTMSRSGPTIL